MRKRWGILDATIATAASLAILIGLGVWQLERRAWKEGLIAQISARLAAPPQPVPAREQWPRLDQQADEFRHVTFPAELLNDQSALVYTAGSSLRPDVNGPGYWVFTPARLLGGSTVVVNRGFVPLERKELAAVPQAGVVVDLAGTLRWPEARSAFTPNDDPNGNMWFVRDQKLIADAKHWGDVAPFYVDLESPQPPGGFPRAGKLVVDLPNNHLQYALTWFGLAAALVGVYLAWLIRRFRR